MTLRDDAISDLKENSVSFFISKWLMDRKVPFIFNNDLRGYLIWKEKLSDAIEVDPCSIVFVGSSCTGISFNPRKDFHPFDEESDIDLAIISNYHFEIAWRFFRNLRSKLFSYHPDVINSIIEHRLNYIYWGTIASDRLLWILPFADTWATALENQKKIPPIGNREIHARIYKDFEALRSYQTLYLSKLKEQLLSER
jgi:hypothetical protein